MCSYEPERLFGEIVDGCMKLSEIGLIVTEKWLRTPMIRINVELGEFVVMPDHLHGIIVLHSE